MTRFILISIFSLAMISLTSSAASTRNTKSLKISVSNSNETGSGLATLPIPLFPATKTVPPVVPDEKNHSIKTEELPHIHHFHKERVKKVKRHHKKYWALSVLVLMLCHIALLVMAYMHVIH